MGRSSEFRVLLAGAVAALALFYCSWCLSLLFPPSGNEGVSLLATREAGPILALTAAAVLLSLVIGWRSAPARSDRAATVAARAGLVALLTGVAGAALGLLRAGKAGELVDPYARGTTDQLGSGFDQLLVTLPLGASLCALGFLAATLLRARAHFGSDSHTPRPSPEPHSDWRSALEALSVFVLLVGAVFSMASIRANWPFHSDVQIFATLPASFLLPAACLSLGGLLVAWVWPRGYPVDLPRLRALITAGLVVSASTVALLFLLWTLTVVSANSFDLRDHPRLIKFARLGPWLPISAQPLEMDPLDKWEGIETVDNLAMALLASGFVIVVLAARDLLGIVRRKVPRWTGRFSTLLLCLGLLLGAFGRVTPPDPPGMVEAFFHSMARALPYTMVAAAFAGPGFVFCASLRVLHARRGAPREPAQRPPHQASLATAGMLALAVGITAMSVVSPACWSVPVSFDEPGSAQAFGDTALQARETGSTWLFYCAVACILGQIAVPVWNTLRRFTGSASTPACASRGRPR